VSAMLATEHPLRQFDPDPADHSAL
jgi:hypothetical protein